MLANIDQHQDHEHHLNVKGNTSPDTCDNKDQGRGNWSRKLDFILSCLSYVVGLGSVWRFPYICFRNGGGAFLIPFFTMLIVIGIPMVFLEMSIGQFASSGAVSIWKASPIFEGVGWAMFSSSFFLCIYYNMIIAYAIHYVFASFKATLPWQECGEWSSEACSNVRTDVVKNCTDNGGVFCYDKCFYQNKVSSSTWNKVTNCSVGNLILPSDDYFHMSVLGITKGIHDMGSIQWKLTLCLLLAWVVVCVCLVKGIKSSGKVWGDAAVQVFYALSLGLGGLITLSSYNKFNNNCFVILGYMAAELNQPISEVVQPGAGLAFIVYPDVVTKLPISQIWSVLFFTMLVTLGFGAQGGMYALQLFDNYVATFSLLVIGVMESIALSWVYGGDRFLTDIESMLGYKPRYIWVWCWRTIVPVALLMILVSTWIGFTPTVYDSFVFPAWADGIGWLLSMVSIMAIPSVMIYKIIKHKKSTSCSIIQSIKFLCKADEEWSMTKKDKKNECAELSCVPVVDHSFSTTHKNECAELSCVPVVDHSFSTTHKNECAELRCVPIVDHLSYVNSTRL
ncbi:hypothetical protein ACF0H5_011397 [Mactra antiquata]